VQQNDQLFDHLVGGGEQRRWHGEASALAVVRFDKGRDDQDHMRSGRRQLPCNLASGPRAIGLRILKKVNSVIGPSPGAKLKALAGGQQTTKRAR
jgi:hypothetical protein